MFKRLCAMLYLWLACPKGGQQKVRGMVARHLRHIAGQFWSDDQPSMHTFLASIGFPDPVADRARSTIKRLTRLQSVDLLPSDILHTQPLEVCQQLRCCSSFVSWLRVCSIHQTSECSLPDWILRQVNVMAPSAIVPVLQSVPCPFCDRVFPVRTGHAHSLQAHS